MTKNNSSTSSLFDTLSSRGYIYQSTDMNNTKKLLDATKTTFYLGVDPTAESLHIGHFFTLMMFRYLQDAGHRGILLFGGATALVGDPSGKSDMRKMLAKSDVDANIAKVVDIAKRFIRMDGDNPAIILNNAKWFEGYDYVSFMRDIGVHFNINKMLSADAYANRINEGGLTFLEMGYMLMQAYDFYYLASNYDCKLQIGGSDQWGNITAGTSLYRKRKFNDDKTTGEALGDNIYGLTCPLLLTKDGKKMGKTENGALWVDGSKTSAYDFYQYFYNVDDKDIELLLKLFTKVDLQEIASILSIDVIQAKKLMAYEITKLVHGQSAAQNAVDAASSLFANAGDSDNVPTVTMPLSMLGADINIIDIFCASKLVATKSQCRQLIDGGGLFAGDTKATDYKMTVNSLIKDNSILLKKGKKSFIKVIFK